MTFPRRDTVEPPPEAAPLTSPGDENLAPTPAPGETAAAVAISLVPQRAPVLREPPAKTTGDGAAHGEFVFHTRQGGVFYLINALNHPSVRALLDDAEAWTSLPSGWAWLFRLGESLGLDIHDPVASFFARESGLESALQLDDLGQLPMREALLDLCARVYAPHGVWQPELLAIEGRVTPTSSHLDVEFPMSAVRLPVRLAGLDLNPGWTPWLGRVVTFHYVSVREGDRL
jgi:hypothetical protein